MSQVNNELNGLFLIEVDGIVHWGRWPQEPSAEVSRRNGSADGKYKECFRHGRNADAHERFGIINLIGIFIITCCLIRFSIYFFLELLQNVVELRATNWGRSPSVPLVANAIPSSLGVYYGPDGQALTAEETEFLNEGVGRLGRNEEEEDYE